MTTLRALHVGDLHFWRVPLNPVSYAGKRLLGVGNLLVGGRARRFRQSMAPILAQHLRDSGADLALFSGDFTTTALPGEFRRAAEVLLPVVESLKLRKAFAVPGNHDCYVRRELGARSLLKNFPKPLHVVDGIEFELLPGGVGLLAMNATTSNGMSCFGQLDAAQLAAIGSLMEQHRGRFEELWVLCHFPVEEPPGVLKHERGPQLRGGEALLKLLAALPCRVIWLHGHHHYRWAYGSKQAPNLVWLNAGAPLMKRGGHMPDLGFHELARTGATTQIRSERRDPGTSSWRSRDVPMPEPGEYINLQDW